MVVLAAGVHVGRDHVGHTLRGVVQHGHTRQLLLGGQWGDVDESALPKRNQLDATSSLTLPKKT